MVTKKKKKALKMKTTRSIIYYCKRAPTGYVREGGRGAKGKCSTVAVGARAAGLCRNKQGAAEGTGRPTLTLNLPQILDSRHKTA